MFQVSISLSTTGFKPCLIKHMAEDIIVKVGIITSSPFKFSDLITISKAAVPLETATPNFLLLNLEKFSSNFFKMALQKKSIQRIMLIHVLFLRKNFGVFTGINLFFNFNF